MSKFRQQLPQLGERRFLTDSGLETDLIFNDGFTLPDFAAFVLLDEEAGRLGLDAYFRRHVQLALDVGVGIVLETPTWRANSDWGTRLGYDATSLKEANCEAVELLLAIREGQGDDGPPVVISGNVGPRAASYSATLKMTADQAFDYHAQQVGILAATEVDLVSALTIAYTDEAIGIARAAITSDVPSVISFTVETDGQLPDGMSVNDAIVAVDGATGAAPAYYMVNCAHPTHLARSFPDEAISPRLRGLRANASRRSHDELDNSEDLDAGDPAEFGHLMSEFAQRAPNVTILGGCCGTDIRHMRAVSLACV